MSCFPASVGAHSHPTRQHSRSEVLELRALTIPMLSIRQHALQIKLDVEIRRLTREMEQRKDAFGQELYDLLYVFVVDKNQELPLSLQDFQREIAAILHECHNDVGKLLDEKRTLEQTAIPSIEARRQRSNVLKASATFSDQLVRATDWVVDTSEKASILNQIQSLDQQVAQRKAKFGEKAWPFCAEVTVPAAARSDKVIGGLAAATASLGSSSAFQAVTKASSKVASRVASRQYGVMAGIGVRRAVVEASTKATQSTSQFIGSLSRRESRVNQCIATMQTEMGHLQQWRQHKFAEKDKLLSQA